MHPIAIDAMYLSPDLSPVTDHECELVDGGGTIEALIGAGIDALELVLYCAVAGQSCFA